ncbi:hypothetical protein BC831DRAFT_483322, partial [Entophlyctis helioformis]
LDSARSIVLEASASADADAGWSAGARSRLCGICMIQGSNYACPRCNVKYCSLSCYKSQAHADCSEAFYRSNFMGELQSQRVSSPERQRMLHMLDSHERKMNEQQTDLDAFVVSGSDHDSGSDDDDRGAAADSEERGDGHVDVDVDVELDLQDRFRDLDLDTAPPEEILARLSEAERKAFQDMLSSNDTGLQRLVPQWAAWWDVWRVHGRHADAATGTGTGTGTGTARVPSVLANLPRVSALLNRRPDARVVLGCLDYLVAYVYVCRTMNGIDHGDATAVQESTRLFRQASYLLDPATPRTFVHETAADCVSVLSSRLSVECRLAGQAVSALLSDVQYPARGSHVNAHTTRDSALAAALSDAHTMLAASSAKADKAAARKLYFLVCLLCDADYRDPVRRMVGECTDAVDAQIERLARLQHDEALVRQAKLSKAAGDRPARRPLVHVLE